MLLDQVDVVRIFYAVVVAAVRGDVTAGVTGDVSLRDPQEGHVLGDKVAHGDSVCGCTGRSH